MDNLEKFIKNNRSSLDRYDPPSESWPRIMKKIRKGKRRVPGWLSAAAVITLVLGIGFTAYNLSAKKKSSEITAGTIQNEIRETEYFYNSMVNSLYREAKPLLAGQPDIEKELNTDLERIDKICSEIKKDLGDNMANQEVIEAIIQNYTIKIRLLEDMLMTLKENENFTEKSKSNEL